MRIASLLMVALIAAVLLGACTENVGLLKLQTVGPAGPLYGRSWYNTHEARPGDTVIYRPQGYVVPPTTPRYGPVYLDGLRFEENGEFTLFTFGPADAPEARLGRWQAVGADKNVVTIALENSEFRPPYRLRVLSVENEKLVLLRLP
jgi:hypothetical protein